MKIYLSGKITGDRNYKHKFEKAAEKLKGYGFDVFNPAVLPSGFEYEQYMQIDFLALSFCDAIYLLEDWEDSSGAMRELEEAKRLGLKILKESDFLYSDTLLQICKDSENLAEDDLSICDDCGEFDAHICYISKRVHALILLWDFDMSMKENFIWLCKNIPEKERLFFYSEFLCDTNIMFDYDCSEEENYSQKRAIRKMYLPAEEMRDLCAEIYGFDKDERFTEESA